MPPEPTATSPGAAPAPRRRGARAFVILGIVAALAIAAYLVHGWWMRGKVTTDNAMVDADVVMVAARVGGPVVRVAVTDNQRVAVGDPILEIDPADYEIKVRQAEADLDAARAQVEAAEAQIEVVTASSSGGKSSAEAHLSASSASVRSAAAQVKVAEAALDRARTELARVDVDFVRTRKLFEQSALPQAQLDAATSAHDAAASAVAQAQAQVAAAREQQRLAEAGVAEARGRVAQSEPVDAQVRAVQAAAHLARARVAAAEVALEQARDNLAKTVVKAPIAGTVSKLAVRAGQTAAPGQTVVAVVPDETYVIANFKETEVGAIKPGQPVEIELDAFPDRTFHGVVDSLSAATGARFSLLPPDNATGNYVKVVQRVPVKIVWKDEPGVALRPGMSADVTVHVN